MAKLSKKQIVDIAWKVAYRTCFAILLILALVSVQDTLENYVAKKSNRSVDKIPISEQPAVSICFDDDKDKNVWDRKMYALGTEVNITYHIYNIKTHQHEVILLKENDNFLPNSNTDLIHVQKMQSCYKIMAKTSNGEYHHQHHQERFFKVVFSNQLKETNQLPEKLTYYFTSEVNSYGVERNIFFEGKESKLMAVQDWLYAVMITETKETKLLSEKSGCSDDSSFWKSLQEIFVPAVKTKCLNPCNPSGLPDGELDLCKSSEDWQCAEEEFSKISKSNNAGLKKTPCSKVEFDANLQVDMPLQYASEASTSLGTVVGGWNFTEPTYLLMYSFLTPEAMVLDEEYLIVSFLDVIGIVGGNLGFFVNFCFYDFIVDFVLLCKTFILSKNSICKKNCFWNMFQRYLCIVFISSFLVKNITIQRSKVFSRIAKCFDWGTFLTLVSLALVSVKGNWDDYVSQKTSISVDKEPIPGHPVMSICMAFVYDPKNVGPPKAYEIGTEVNITYWANSIRFVQ